MLVTLLIIVEVTFHINYFRILLFCTVCSAGGVSYIEKYEVDSS